MYFSGSLPVLVNIPSFVTQNVHFILILLDQILVRWSFVGQNPSFSCHFSGGTKKKTPLGTSSRRSAHPASRINAITWWGCPWAIIIYIYIYISYIFILYIYIAIQIDRVVLYTIYVNQRVIKAIYRLI